MFLKSFVLFLKISEWFSFILFGRGGERHHMKALVVKTLNIAILTAYKQVF